MRAFQPRFVPTPAWSEPTVQRKCSACGTQTAGGNCPKCRKAQDEKTESGIQTKLNVSQPGDRYEQEADRVADAVVSGKSLVPGMASSGAAGVQRAGEDMDEEADDDDDDADADLDDEAEGAEVMRKAQGTAAPDALIPRGGGQPLAAAPRRFMEQRFGHSFADVSVHTDAAAAKSAEQLGARAYTHGADVYFGAGRYQPGTQEGQRLLAHELTHVLQQRGGKRGVFRDDDKDAKPKAKKAVTKEITVDLGANTATATEDGKVVRSMPALGGRPGHPTHTGNSFKTQKGDPDHTSSEYGTCGTRKVTNGARSCKKGEKYVGAPMKNFVRFNGKEGFHQGSLSEQSHGCVHLSAKDAQWLIDWAAVGTNVVVKGGAKPKGKKAKPKSASSKSSAKKKAKK